MGRMYTVIFEKVTVSVAQDLFEIVAASDVAVVIHAAYVGQSSDVDSEQLLVAIRRGQTTSGSGGSAPTPTPTAAGDAAFGGTVEVNNTTKASVGTIVTLHLETFNILNGWVYTPTPETRITISPGIRGTIELVDAPADALTMSGTLLLEEIGG